MKLRTQEAKKNKKELKIFYTWVDYDKISNNLKLAVIISEDTSFFTHHGFNYKAIRLAYSSNRKIGAKKYGASTISQQTVKNLFLWNEKSWTRKILEAYFTILVETFWGKKRVLEVYLNIIEYGNGVFGAQAAAEQYFSSSAAKINQYQASLLAVSLRSPLRMSIKNPSKILVIRAKVNKIIVTHGRKSSAIIKKL